MQIGQCQYAETLIDISSEVNQYKETYHLLHMHIRLQTETVHAPLKLLTYQSKKDSKDQILIQSSTTPVPRYQMGK